MLYPVIVALLFSGLFVTSAQPLYPHNLLLLGALVTFLCFASLYFPRHLIKYTFEDPAPNVLTKLMRRALFGSILLILAGVGALFLVNAWTNPVFLGEVYFYLLIGVLLLQVVGEVMTHHVIYLQRTHQYNSNQLFAMLAGIALLIFVLVLYFLAFDLAQPPNLHNYVRDLLAVTLVLGVYSRAVYLMAHH